MDATSMLTTGDAARLLPRSVSPATVWRWARRGLRTRSGRVLRLQHVRVGGRVYTTREWLDAFVRELTDDTPDRIAPRTETRRAEIAEAEQRLREYGL